MNSILVPFNKIVHDTSAALIDNQIPKRLADMVSASVNSGFEVVEDLLKIAKDITQEEESQGGTES